MATKLSLKKEYEEFETGRGVVLKIYSVPGQLIENIATPYDHEKPKRPFVIMKTKGGEQKRPIKQGDEGWEEYQESVEKWEEKCDEFRSAVSMVMAIKKSVEYPNPLDVTAFEDDTRLLIEQGFLALPNNEWELKCMWLRDKILGGHDEIQIQWILRRFSGVPEAVIEQQKARFWNILSGKVSQPVVNGNGISASDTEVSEQEQSVLEVE